MTENKTKKTELEEDLDYVVVEDAFEDVPLPPHQKLLTSTEFLTKFKSVDFRTGDIGVCGVPVGSNNGRIYVCDKPYHTAIEAASRKGKSHSESLPIAALSCYNGESVVYLTTRSNDVGYIYDLSCQMGRETTVIDLSSPEYSDSTDALAHLKELRSCEDMWSRLKGEIMANRVANISMNTEHIHSTNPEWIMGTMMICHGLLLFAADHLPGRMCNTLAMAEILEALMDDETSLIKKAISSNPKYRNLLSPILLSSAHSTKEGYKSVFYSTVMSTLGNPIYAHILNGGDKDITRLDEKPGTVIMLVPEGDYSAILTASIMLTIMHMSMINRIDASPEAKAATKVNFIIDEAGAIPLPFLPDGVSQGAARGFQYVLSYQSEGQLRSLYGAGLAESILSNCRLKIYLGSADPEAINRYVAQLGGFKEDPLISADQLRKMSNGQALVFCDGLDPYFGRLLDFGTQVPLYPLRRERQKYHDVPIPDISKWFSGCDESDLLFDDEGCMDPDDEGCMDPDDEFDYQFDLIPYTKKGLKLPATGDNDIAALVNDGIERTDGKLNTYNLSYGLLEAFVLNEQDKRRLLALIDDNTDTIQLYAEIIQSAMIEVRRKISALSQKQLDEVYGILRPD